MNKESLKIYSVASVWPKWQIILPLECREDLKIDIWNIFNIWRIENIAFVISKEDSENNESFSSLPEKDEKNILKKDLLKKCFFGNFETKIKVWTKFQFVIPVEIRNQLEIKPGDTLLIVWWSLSIIWKKWNGIWFIRNDKINFLFHYIKKYFSI